jgi:Zn-finger nucleic acid-binding protein
MLTASHQNQDMLISFPAIDSVSPSDCIVWMGVWLVNNELEKIWKKERKKERKKEMSFEIW